MKILQICSRIPYPLKDGGAIAMYNMVIGLSKAVEHFSLFSLNTSKHFITPEEIPSSLPFVKNLKWVYADNRIKPLSALISLVGSGSYHAERFMVKEAELALAEMLKKTNYDIIQLEGINMTNYVSVIRKYSNAKIVLRAHNIEHQIWERLSIKASGFKKWYLKILAARLKKFEIRNALKVDAITAITEQDAEYFKSIGCICPIFVSPTGVLLDMFQPNDSQKEQLSIFHLGSLEWMPNREGIYWFLENVWPELHRRNPQLKFYIAGRNMPENFLNQKYPNVEAIGEVHDAISFMNSKNIMVVPLFSGSGMRVKIIEGMALGKVIISTPIGAEGIDAQAGKQLFIASTPAEFIEQIITCLDNIEMCKQVSNSARKQVALKYDNTRLISQLLKSYSKL